MLAGLKYKPKIPKPAEFDNLTVVGNKAQSNSPTKAKGFDPKEDFQF